MNINVLSRAYLQGLPENYKQQHISMRIRPFVEMVKGHASAGKNSLMVYDHEYLRDAEKYPTLTAEDFIAAFKKIFPDCGVSYEERWEEPIPTKRVVKKGILIDWS
jgi:hypothetical protein